VAPYLTLMSEAAPQRRHDRREVFNGLRFIDRWAGWFGDAAAGNLHMPTRLPER
jgi:hypothetical protein